MDDPARHYTARSVQHEPDHSYPDQVKIVLEWKIDGMIRSRIATIDSEVFFGTGGNGAPMAGFALIAAIENMRRQGAPPLPPKGKKHGRTKKRR